MDLQDEFSISSEEEEGGTMKLLSSTTSLDEAEELYADECKPFTSPGLSPQIRFEEEDQLRNKLPQQTASSTESDASNTSPLSSASVASEPISVERSEVFMSQILLAIRRVSLSTAGFDTSLDLTPE